MVPDRDRLSLQSGLTASGMNYDELWMRQIAVGGDANELELEAYVLGLLKPDALQYNMIAQAINEHFIDCGDNPPVGYWDAATSE